MTTSDSALIEQCLNGDSNAFGELVLRYQNRLFNSILRKAVSEDEAAEVVQQAFVHAYRKLNTFRGESAFYSWLFRIAMNVFISEKRKQKRAAFSLEGSREKAGVEPVDHRVDTDPARPMDTLEKQRLVQQALSELTEEFRTVIVLKEIDGLKYEQIAEVIDCPVGTVRSRLHRAREELRIKLHVLLAERGELE